MGVKLELHQIYSKKWSATYFLLALIASDLDHISNQDFQMGALTLFNFTKRENFRYKFGIYGHTEFYRPLILPLFGMYYTSPNQKWGIDFILPILVDVNYKLLNKVTAGINFDGLGSTYNLSQSFTLLNNTYVVKSSNELYTYLRFQFGKSIYLKTMFGYSFFRSYKVFEEHEKVNLSIASINFADKRTTLNNEFKDGMLLKLKN